MLLVVTVLVAAMLVVAWNRNYRAESEWDQDPQPPVHVNILQAKIWNWYVHQPRLSLQTCTMIAQCLEGCIPSFLYM